MEPGPREPDSRVQQRAIYAQVGESLPGSRVGRAEEIAQATRLLMTNAFMTGAVLARDGGHLVRA